jgi:hypothetical protein
MNSNPPPDDLGVDLDGPPAPDESSECCASGRCEVCRPDLKWNL